MVLQAGLLHVFLYMLSAELHVVAELPNSLPSLNCLTQDHIYSSRVLPYRFFKDDDSMQASWQIRATAVMPGMADTMFGG